MSGLSDILILFAKPLDDEAARRAKACLMNADASVLVHQKEGQSRIFIVKFDPSALGPAQVLNAVLNEGFEATMAGG